MRLLFFLVAEYWWVLEKMDIDSAYSKAKELSHEVFVRPPKKEDIRWALWRLLVPAYRIIDSERLWYITSHEALTRRFEFAKLTLASSTYMREGGSKRLILVVQDDNYLYARSTRLASKFEQFSQNQFHIGSTGSKSFSMMSPHLVQLTTAKIIIDGKNKLNRIQPLVAGTSKKKDCPATEEEQTAYWPVIGKLLYVGRRTSPEVFFHASKVATKCGNLHLQHPNSLNAALRTITKWTCTITYLPGEGWEFGLEEMFDDSMRTTDEKEMCARA